MLTEDVKANKTALLRAYKIEPQLSTKKLLFEIKYCLHFLLEVSRDAMRHFSPSFNFISGFLKVHLETKKISKLRNSKTKKISVWNPKLSLNERSLYKLSFSKTDFSQKKFSVLTSNRILHLFQLKYVLLFIRSSLDGMDWVKNTPVKDIFSFKPCCCFCSFLNRSNSFTRKIGGTLISMKI